MSNPPSQPLFLLTAGEIASLCSLDPGDVTAGRFIAVGDDGVELWELSADTGPDGTDTPRLRRLSAFATAPQISMKARRGDATPLVHIGDVPVVAIDGKGHLVARISPAALRETLAQMAAAPDMNFGALLRISTPLSLRRGDSSTLVKIGAAPAVAVRGDGSLAARLDEQSIAHIADAIPLPGGRPEPPDHLSAYDAWGARRAGDLLYFTGNLWGDHPRDYVKRGSADPWAVSISEVLLRLTFGDEYSDAPVSVPVDHFAHLLVFDDGAGVEGLGGDTTPQDKSVEEIDRVGPCFSAASADSFLRYKKGAKPWIGVRSEAVPGATLDDLTIGVGFENLANALGHFRHVVAPYGKVAATDVVTIMHGNSDSDPDYKAKLLHLCRKIVEATGARQINLFQPVGSAFDHDAPAVMATVEAFRERGNLPLILVAPTYPAARRPGSMLQPTADTMTMLAELDGLARRDWLPPLAFAAERDGSTIAVDFEVMDGHSLIAPSFGLRFVTDAGVDIPVLGAIVTMDPFTGKLTRLTVTLDGAPDGPGELSYAYGNVEPSFDLSGTEYRSAGDLRDDWSMPSVTGGTLYRYAFAFRFYL